MFGLYIVKDINGNKKIMRASAIYKKVCKDFYEIDGLIAPAAELVNLCDKKDFPQRYSELIKEVILRYYKRLLSRNEYISNDEIKAAYYAYNSLFGNSEFDIILEEFLWKFLYRIFYDSFHNMINCNDDFMKLGDEWIREKYNRMKSIKNLNFEDIKISLEKELKKFIEETPEINVSLEDEKESTELQKKIFRKFADKYGIDTGFRFEPIEVIPEIEFPFKFSEYTTFTPANQEKSALYDRESKYPGEEHYLPAPDLLKEKVKILNLKK